ncbi:hypothetical protein EDB81DRAFT_769752 [Dactylonectria macrodidyma]|uniref:Uncharacterized protein n=1 Tax=Dactylonectria macrodidyma TaxID=307937 RepID=A0A9P9FTP3_9HYPO|nr:hypothetical protein EDB81DRAFT_769752 [Dactylonectria macrodidyma]
MLVTTLTVQGQRLLFVWVFQLSVRFCPVRDSSVRAVLRALYWRILEQWPPRRTMFFVPEQYLRACVGNSDYKFPSASPTCNTIDTHHPQTYSHHQLSQLIRQPKQLLHKPRQQLHVPSDNMCLTLILHQADREVECTSLISPDSNVQISNPYQLPACSLTYEADDRQGFDVPCIVSQWQSCVTRPEGIPCFGWEHFHLVVHRSEVQEAIRKITLDLKMPPMSPQDPKWLSTPEETVYIDVRKNFFRAGQGLALATTELHVAKQRLQMQYDEETLDEVYRYRTGLLVSMRNWVDAVVAWERYAKEGKMEVCPADGGIEGYPLEPFLKISYARHGSPDQLMDDTEGEQLDLILEATHVAKSPTVPELPVHEFPVPESPSSEPASPGFDLVGFDSSGSLIFEPESPRYLLDAVSFPWSPEDPSYFIIGSPVYRPCTPELVGVACDLRPQSPAPAVTEPLITESPVAVTPVQESPVRENPRLVFPDPLTMNEGLVHEFQTQLVLETPPSPRRDS